jgi:hypothetical protein
MTQQANISLPPAITGGTPAAEPDWLRPLVEKIVAEVTAKATPTTPFTDLHGLVRYLPMYGQRSLRQMIKDKVLPVCRPPGSRKICVHIPSIEQALLRWSRGGAE